MHKHAGMAVMSTAPLFRLVECYQSARVPVLLVKRFTYANVLGKILGTRTFGRANLPNLYPLTMTARNRLVLSVFCKEIRHVSKTRKNRIAGYVVNRKGTIIQKLPHVVLIANNFPVLVPNRAVYSRFLFCLVKIGKALILTDIQGVCLPLITLWLIVHSSSP
jgi:hypothetical protein